jgi:hypothetical protein
MTKDTERTLPLVDVVCEIVASLASDDWGRFSTDDGRRHYYIVGERDWAHSIDNEVACEVSWKGADPVSAPGEYLFRHALAEGKPAGYYREIAVAKATRVGLDVRAMDALLADPAGIPLSSVFPNGVDAEQSEAFSDCVNAHLVAQIERGDERAITRCVADLENAREKILLQHFCERYRKAVSRAATLDAIPFIDDQIAEATRCCLHGFYRATVVVAAAALEKWLKKLSGVEFIEHYATFLDACLERGILGPDRGLHMAADVVFTLRTAVVHRGAAPNKTEAEEVLGLARNVIEHLSILPIR